MARESETAEAPAAEAAPQEQAQKPVAAPEELAAAAVEEQKAIVKRLSTPADGDAAASRPGTATSSSASATLPEVKDLVADLLRRTSTLTVEVRAPVPRLAAHTRVLLFAQRRSRALPRCAAEIPSSDWPRPAAEPWDGKDTALPRAVLFSLTEA
jgi:hypothetical protein